MYEIILLNKNGEKFAKKFNSEYLFKKFLTKIKYSKTLKIIRQLDLLGRVVIPKEFREMLNINEKDKIEIFLLQDGLFMRKSKIQKHKV